MNTADPIRIMLEKSLNARAGVEQEMFDCARGTAPMPDAAKLREWAMRLGVPDECRPDPVKDAARAAATAEAVTIYRREQRTRWDACRPDSHRDTR